MKKPRLSFALEDNACGLPLDDLLDRAAATLDRNGDVEPKMRTWLARCALRAVCEAILRDNCVTMPLKVKVVSEHQLPLPVYASKLRNVIPIDFHRG